MEELLYPFGLLRLWIIARGKKSFRQIIKEEGFDKIATHGPIFFMDLVAASGALAVIGLVLTVIGVSVWGVIKAWLEM